MRNGMYESIDISKTQKVSIEGNSVSNLSRLNPPEQKYNFTSTLTDYRFYDPYKSLSFRIDKLHALSHIPYPPTFINDHLLSSSDSFNDYAPSTSDMINIYSSLKIGIVKTINGTDTKSRRDYFIAGRIFQKRSKSFRYD